MTDFGDFEPADAVDTDPPDPLAVARLMVRLERQLSGDDNRPATFEQLHPFERALRLYVLAVVIAKLRREWKNDP